MIGVNQVDLGSFSSHTCVCRHVRIAQSGSDVQVIVAAQFSEPPLFSHVAFAEEALSCHTTFGLHQANPTVYLVPPPLRLSLRLLLHADLQAEMDPTHLVPGPKAQHPDRSKDHHHNTNKTTTRRDFPKPPYEQIMPQIMTSPEDCQRPATRKLVLCFDGTGNKFRGDDSDSNILKIFRCLDREANDQCE